MSEPTNPYDAFHPVRPNVSMRPNNQNQSSRRVFEFRFTSSPTFSVLFRFVAFFDLGCSCVNGFIIFFHPFSRFSFLFFLLPSFFLLLLSPSRFTRIHLFIDSCNSNLKCFSRIPYFFFWFYQFYFVILALRFFLFFFFLKELLEGLEQETGMRRQMQKNSTL